MSPSTSNPSSAPPTKICFNPDCKDANSDRWRKGWRLRSGDFADLCDRCGCAYDEVRFCEVFHNNAPGWRKCESCAKRMHCGCVASVHSFLLLDAGGIECMGCAKKSLYMASNQMWQSSLFFPANLPQKLKDLSAKNWNQIYGPGSAPGHWRPVTNVWNGQPELLPRVPFEVDRLGQADNLVPSDRPVSTSEEKKKVEELPERLKLASLDRLTNAARKGGTAEAALTGAANGLSFSANSNSFTNSTLLASAQKEDRLPSRFGVSLPSVNEIKEPKSVAGASTPRQPSSPSVAKQFYNSANNLTDTSGDTQNHVRNGRIRAEARGRNQLLPRYWPRITDQELQQISGDSNSVITPLFEKMLSASDAGRIGRLVLPKKCAEAYFPAISQPEGQPLKVQDSKGKEWVFQFRFWPNNNSRMYVLEGVTPCIQSMQLQAGDIVTFSRMDPEGKLIMGFRKASAEQDIQGSTTVNGHPANGQATNRNSNLSEPVLSLPVQPPKGAAESSNKPYTNHTNSTDASWAKLDKAGGKSKNLRAKPFLVKRKNNILGSKTKRLRIEDEDSMELKLTWEEAQSFLRPPPDREPSIIVVEGHEFEEYEEAPILGKPIFFTTNLTGERNQWAQCEDCSKWRKLPADVVLPSRWTCHANVWDCERSSCSVPEEVSSKQRENIFSTKSGTRGSKFNPKRKRLKVEAEKVDTAEGLDTLANVAILGEDGSGPPSSQATTKHPRHRPGCTCIVCIQPPSGKGPKHKQSCTCNVCLTVKRRFRTLMMRREKRLSEKEADTCKKKQQLGSPDKIEAGEDEEGGEDNCIFRSDNGSLTPDLASDELEATLVKMEFSSSPFKGQIDLNIQPEREEEPITVMESSKTERLIEDAAVSYPVENMACPEGKNDGVHSMMEPDSEIREKTLESAARTESEGDHVSSSNASSLDIKAS